MSTDNTFQELAFIGDLTQQMKIPSWDNPKTALGPVKPHRGLQRRYAQIGVFPRVQAVLRPSRGGAQGGSHDPV
jgi:hypothetical protein